MDQETVKLVIAIIALILAGVSLGMAINNLAYILCEIRKNSKDSRDNAGNSKKDI